MITTKGSINCAVVFGGALIAFAEKWGPVVSFVAGAISILWAGISLYFLLKRELGKKK